MDLRNLVIHLEIAVDSLYTVSGQTWVKLLYVIVEQSYGTHLMKLFMTVILYPLLNLYIMYYIKTLVLLYRRTSLGQII